MKSNKRASRIVVLTLMLSLAFVGCSKKKNVGSAEDGYEDVSQAAIDDGRATSDSDNAMGLKTVQFGFDSHVISSYGRNVLNSNIEIMKQNDDLKVQIEGHCDERGGIQYNLALGERRAHSIKKYMTSRGISSSRVTTLSLGKEQPIAFGSSEDAWAKNRRGNFVITSK